jgi:hypothetical protein
MESDSKTAEVPTDDSFGLNDDESHEGSTGIDDIAIRTATDRCSGAARASRAGGATLWVAVAGGVSRPQAARAARTATNSKQQMEQKRDHRSLF